MECGLVDAFRWPLCQIDETDIESLIPFIFRYPKWKQEQKSAGHREREAYADQVEL